MRSVGFTVNASFRGLGISAQSVVPAGTFLHIELKLSGDKPCLATGTVVWSMRGMSALKVPGTMGVRIETADESFFHLLAENTADDTGKMPVAKAPVASPAVMPRPLRAGAVTPVGTPPVRPVIVAPAPPAPKMAFRFPRLPDRLDVQFGQLGIPAPAGMTPRTPSPTAMNQAGVTTNVSRSGFAMGCGQALKPGDEVRFSLKLPDGKSCEGRGSVIWTRLEATPGGEQPQMGIHIARIDPSYRDHLQWLSRRAGVSL